MNTLENLYYGNIDPHEHTVSNGTDKGELLETVVRLETELRAALTEQQKTLLEQFEKGGCRNFRQARVAGIRSRLSIGSSADDGSVRADAGVRTVTKNSRKRDRRILFLL